MFGLTGIIAGIVLVLLGGFFLFMLSSPAEYQPAEFSTVFVFTGIILAIVGVLLIFWW